MIDNDVMAIYGCSADGKTASPYIQYGGWTKADSNTKEDVRYIKTRDNKNWNVYIQEIWANNMAVYKDDGGLAKKNKMRTFAVEP